MMNETTPKREVAGSVLAQSQMTNTISGNVVASNVPTNMSISGTGFFTVVKKTGDANSQPVFGSTLCTHVVAISLKTKTVFGQWFGGLSDWHDCRSCNRTNELAQAQ